MKLAHNYYVYILQCCDGFYYVGVTNNVDKRVEQHNERPLTRIVILLKEDLLF